MNHINKLNDNTLTLLSFLQTIPDTKQMTLSRTSNLFLELLIKEIINAENVWEAENINTRFIKYSKTEKNFPAGNDYKYFPTDIRNEIENMDKLCCVSSFIVSGRNIRLSIITPGIKKYKRSYFIECIKLVYLWLSVASQYSPSKCSQDMNIFFYFTDLKKCLPKEHGEPLTENNVNTAFTTSCKPTTELNLFRNEEWFKVFIHETFHNMGLDFSEFNQTKINKNILSIFPLEVEVRLFETYCETWAEILNVVFVSYFSNHGENLDIMMKQTEKMIDHERTFSLFQCAKVLHYYGITYEELYEKNTAASLIRRQRYKEKTNVLSYYILKSILLFHSEDFIQWCLRNNGDSICFSKTNIGVTIDEKMDSYCKFIGDRYKKKEFQNSLSNFESWFEQSDSGDRFEIQTLRMSLYEM